jgi:hypothetical protein
MGEEMKNRLNRHDALFLVETLMPGRADRETIAERLRAGDYSHLETLLDDDRLFQRLMREENVLLQVSPWFFFTALLRRAWRDLEQEAFTVEKRGRQKLVLFDADRVVHLLAQEPVRDYLATMLASFTRVEHMTVLTEVRPGTWRAYRTNELNIEGMMRYSRTLDEPFRFTPYKRIGDACLFLTGMFPEYINGQYRYPVSGQVRPRMRGRIVQKIEDFEAYGRAFYQKAAEHDVARREGQEGVLSILSENFILAEKPLAFIAARYLQFARHTLFGL